MAEFWNVKRLALIWPINFAFGCYKNFARVSVEMDSYKIQPNISVTEDK
jgi:hypothetical protein